MCKYNLVNGVVAPVVEMLKIEARQKEIRVNVINNLNDSFRY